MGRMPIETTLRRLAGSGEGGSGAYGAARLGGRAGCLPAAALAAGRGSGTSVRSCSLPPATHRESTAPCRTSWARMKDAAGTNATAAVVSSRETARPGEVSLASRARRHATLSTCVLEHKRGPVLARHHVLPGLQGHLPGMALLVHHLLRPASTILRGVGRAAPQRRASPRRRGSAAARRSGLGSRAARPSGAQRPGTLPSVECSCRLTRSTARRSGAPLLVAGTACPAPPRRSTSPRQLSIVDRGRITRPVLETSKLLSLKVTDLLTSTLIVSARKPLRGSSPRLELGGRWR